MTLRQALIALAMGATAPFAHAAGQPPLELVATIPMPDVRGRIDHFDVDVKGHRLFISALGNNTVELIDIESGRHAKRIPGFGEPQGLAYLPESSRLYVANGGAGRVDVLDGGSLALLKRIAELDDADNVRYDRSQGTVVVGYGQGALRIIRSETAESVGDIVLSGHPESFQLEQNGSRAFVNVPSARQVAVVDRAKHEVIATWDVPGARENFPLALDEQGRRLFVGTRSPGMMLVYDIDSGKVVAKMPIGGDTDDIFFDRARMRVYVICGEGRIDIFRAESHERYTSEGSIQTAPRARTGLFVPEESRIYVGAPATSTSVARVLVYQAR